MIKSYSIHFLPPLISWSALFGCDSTAIALPAFSFQRHSPPLLAAYHDTIPMTKALSTHSLISFVVFWINVISFRYEIQFTFHFNVVDAGVNAIAGGNLTIL